MTFATPKNMLACCKMLDCSANLPGSCFYCALRGQATTAPLLHLLQPVLVQTLLRIIALRRSAMNIDKCSDMHCSPLRDIKKD
eukprot:1796102-Amphidinium_carterae.1